MAYVPGSGSTMDMQTALEHHRAGRLAEAAQIYQRILEQDPNQPDALHLMGNAACQLGDAALAVALIARALALRPDTAGYLLSLAMAHRAQGQHEQALAAYREVLALDAGSASAHFGIGNTLQAMGQPQPALDSFATALELNPDLIEARFNLANLEKSLGHHEAAIAHYRTAIAQRPDFADAHHNLGSALQALGRFDEALASYRLALSAKLPETHNNIANILAGRGQFEPALAHYRQALDIKPDYAEASNNMGNALRQLDRFDDALAAFAAALRIAPDYAAAHLSLGALLMARDQLDDAERHYRAALATAPAQAHFHLGLLKDRQDDLPAARASFERAIACRGDLVDAIYNLGVVLGRLLRPADAEQRYRQVLALDPEHVDAHINLSAILIDTERREEGRVHIDHAYTRQNVFTHSSAGAKRTVLILFDAGKGNMNLSYLFKRPANNIIDWMIAYAGEQQASQLPPYDLVFNAMGDADLTAGTEEPMRRFLAVCDKPLLNPPALVARTARDKLPALLDGLDHLLVPAVWRYADHTQWPAALADQLPLLVRPIYSHGGVGLTLVHSREELAQLQALRPGPVYVSRYIDYRSDDGWFRKYRMIFIDRKPYPYHLAISPNWMVHYYNAGMTELAWKLEEERVYLQDPGRVLGAAGMRAIEAIAARMDLDYAGIDFTLLPDGRILVFEANPTMLAHPEDPAGPLAHKNLSTQRIFDAFEALLERRCAA